MSKTDVVVVTGVLGAGKTTALNKLYPGVRERNLRAAGVINDVAAINVDGARVDIPDEDVSGYAAGCLCCERREDLEEALGNIDLGLYDIILVEPTGAANPFEIIGTVVDHPDLDLMHVVNTVPIGHYRGVRGKTSFRTGLQTASLLVQSWYDPESENHQRYQAELHALLGELNAGETPIITLDGLTYDDLDAHPRWTNRLMESVTHDGHGHEHYHTTVRPINPRLNRDEVMDILEELAKRGITRAKGEVPAYQLAFDIVGGELVTREYSGKGAMGYIVAIDEGELPEDILAKASTIEGFDNEKIPFAASDSTPEDRLESFHYYHSRSIGISPAINGVVQANFEGPDEGYASAKGIAQRDGDTNPLQLALGPYVDVRLRALQALESSEQPNKVYTGAVLGSFALQMLGEWDGIAFDKLVDPKQKTQLEREVAPGYFGHLSEFDVPDLLQLKDKAAPYSGYFVLMANNAVPYVDRSLAESAAKNMEQVYRRAHETDREKFPGVNLLEYAERWGEFYAA